MDERDVVVVSELLLKLAVIGVAFLGFAVFGGGWWYMSIRASKPLDPMQGLVALFGGQDTSESRNARRGCIAMLLGGVLLVFALLVFVFFWGDQIRTERNAIP